MKYSITTLFCLTAVIAAFICGLTIRDYGDPLTPVLVAGKPLEADRAVSPDDFRVELHRLSTVPYASLTEKNEIQPNSATTRILNEGQPVLDTDLRRYVLFGSYPSIPKNLKLYAIKLNSTTHALANHLLSEGDNISLSAIFLDTNGKKSKQVLVKSATVFSKSPKHQIVGLLISESESRSVSAAVKDKCLLELQFDPPVIGE